MMSQNVPTFSRTATRDRAAALVADDALADEQIAAQCGVNRRTLTRWRRHPAFQAWVAEHRAAQLAAVKERGIAEKQNRVGALHDRWERLQRLIAARATELAEIPGGDTGLLVRTVKLSATGKEVAEYGVDTGLLRELREIEKQAAQELGQWVEKHDQSGEGKLTVRVVYDDHDGTDSHAAPA